MKKKVQGKSKRESQREQRVRHGLSRNTGAGLEPREQEPWNGRAVQATETPARAWTFPQGQWGAKAGLQARAQTCTLEMCVEEDHSGCSL